MVIYYLDSSALVKRYIEENGSVWVRDSLAPGADNQVFIAAITQVEITAAIMGRVRNNSVLYSDAIAVCEKIADDVANEYQIVQLTEAVFANAVTLAMQQPLRGYDAVQLAAALAINHLCIASDKPPLTFVSADARLNKVASTQGLRVEDPNQHP